MHSIGFGNAASPVTWSTPWHPAESKRRAGEPSDDIGQVASATREIRSTTGATDPAGQRARLYPRWSPQYLRAPLQPRQPRSDKGALEQEPAHLRLCQAVVQAGI